LTKALSRPSSRAFFAARNTSEPLIVMVMIASIVIR
jgi:hypothetical protein